MSVLISDPTENLLKESKGTSWGPINTGVQKGKRMNAMVLSGRAIHILVHSYFLLIILFFYKKQHFRDSNIVSEYINIEIIKITNKIGVLLLYFNYVRSVWP